MRRVIEIYVYIGCKRRNVQRINSPIRMMLRSRSNNLIIHFSYVWPKPSRRWYYASFYLRAIS